MNSTDTSLLTVLCIVSVIVAVTLIVILFFVYKNSIREGQARFRDVQLSAPTLNSLPLNQGRMQEALPEPWLEETQNDLENDNPNILFGSGMPIAPPSPERLQWGNRIDDKYTKVSSKICPVCKKHIDDITNTQKRVSCNTCTTIYHQECWDFLSKKCCICNEG